MYIHPLYKYEKIIDSKLFKIGPNSIMGGTGQQDWVAEQLDEDSVGWPTWELA
jgi:hypothetical protein